jgi:hypothetical protein
MIPGWAIFKLQITGPQSMPVICPKPGHWSQFLIKANGVTH